MSDLHETYREQRGCHNCRHRFTKTDFDSESVLYCTLYPPERPLCGSSAMDEGFGSGAPTYSDEAYLRHIQESCRAWDAWSEGREVRPAGICSHWEGP